MRMRACAGVRVRGRVRECECASVEQKGMSKGVHFMLPRAREGILRARKRKREKESVCVSSHSCVLLLHSCMHHVYDLFKKNV